MEFRFNVNEYFKKPIVEIRNTLLPPDFAGDRRALWNTVNKVAEVINEMGEASAHAQGLNKPITTAERLRQSDQSLYLLIDPEGNDGNGAVTGMLKVGRKGLYVFDREGQHYQVTPPCILDFYVHEKRQRGGLGKKLFEYMLEKENVKPRNLAIDRPSDKFLHFLNKHYNLHSPVKQMNNYVVFDGFFPDGKKEEQTENNPINRTNGLQSAYSHNTPSYGRYGAPRPPCSMGQIIHNTTSQKNSEPASANNRQNNLSNQQCQQQYQPEQVNQQNVAAHQHTYYPVEAIHQVPTSNNLNSSSQQYANVTPSSCPPVQFSHQVPTSNNLSSSSQQFANVSPSSYPPLQVSHQVPKLNYSQQFADVAPSPLSMNTLPQQHTFQNYQAPSSPQAQQISPFPQYQQPYQLNPANSQGAEVSQMANLISQNYHQMTPHQNNFDPNQGSSNVPTAVINIPQQQIPQQLQDTNYVGQNQNIAQTSQVKQIASPQPPLQEQIRMFPEKELESRRLPYQTMQYAENVQTNQNIDLPAAEYQNQPTGHIWPTQLQPQQVYRMSEGLPTVPRSQQSDAPISQSQVAQSLHAQQFTEQQENPYFVKPHQTLQSPEQTPHASQSVVHREDQHFGNTYDRNVYYQENAGNQNEIPQQEERYVPQQTYLRQPDRTLYNVQKTHLPHIQYSAQQKHGYQPHHQQHNSQQQQEKQPTKSDENSHFKSETVHSLLHVDPKYFKPDPVHIKQPSETLVQNPTNRPVRQEETVDSLLRAEQEFFENGQLREKYRIPVRHTAGPSSQHLMTPHHRQFCPNRHGDEIVDTEQGGYPRQVQQHPTQRQKQYFEQRPYIPQELYEQQKQAYAQKVQKVTQPNQPRMPFSTQPQNVPPKQYLPLQMQQDVQEAREQDQYQNQAHFIPQEQYQPQQMVTPQTYSQFPPQASPQQYVKQEFHQSEAKNVFTDQFQPQQQYHHGGQHRYEPVQNVSQEIFNPQTQPSTDHQQLQYIPERRPDIEENPSTLTTFQEPKERRDVAKYNVETAGSAPPEIHGREEPQLQQIGDKLEAQTIEGNAIGESSGGQVCLQENTRHSSYIANDFNRHVEGPGKKPDIKNDGSTDLPAQRKKRVDRQYGLNDTDMRRKSYKSAIIRRTTDAQEQDTLEFGYPPQVDKKRPPPRNILTMRGR